MPYLAEFLTVAAAHLLAVMSPGPDFIMISRNSLVYSRKSALYSALGLALGILLHVTYSLAGIALIISQSIVVFSIIKFLGAGYLIYIGYKSLHAKPVAKADTQPEKKDDLTAWAFIRMGFLTNALNPKASLFFLALFTQVISQTTPLTVQILYGLEMSAMTFVWFAVVALALSNNLIKKRSTRIQHYVERAFGVVLITLGIKVALSSSK